MKMKMEEMEANYHQLLIKYYFLIFSPLPPDSFNEIIAQKCLTDLFMFKIILIIFFKKKRSVLYIKSIRVLYFQIFLKKEIEKKMKFNFLEFMLFI